MKNLEQIRAANALKAGQNGEFRGVNDGEIVKKIPAMIRQNGLLATLAFAVECNDKGKLKHEGHHDVWKAIIEHLADGGIGRLTRNCMPDEFIKHLSTSEKATSESLRDLTEEILAYLNYLRRFARKEA
jgi:CRISPR-associated protein Cmr5